MIKFTLKCEQDHRFESWFQSADAFDRLQKAGHVACAICGSDKVDKALMTPRVQEARRKPGALGRGDETASEQSPDVTAQALAALRKHVEANSDYVGGKFAQEARDMHDGLVPHRAIHGEARPDEARKLIEDGVPVTPLPFTPGRKAN
ncbi:DUF1178 family protein [Roseovarius sp. C7]|uniref:DUF1178 family protein n=1 Tax=Roseovarius sp. C7 TaxID=3398643 RepID=UPI0039F68712